MPFIKSLLLISFLLFQWGLPAYANLWTEVTQVARKADLDLTQDRAFEVNKTALRRILARADYAGSVHSSSIIELPLSQGRIERFRLEQSPIMAPELAAKFPQFKSYRVTGIDDPARSGRLSLSRKGFHGMISGPQGTEYINPLGSNRYRVFDRGQRSADSPFHCGVKSHTLNHPVTIRARRSASRTAGSLRVYRLAVAATVEYTEAVKDSHSITDAEKKADAMSEIGIAINRVNVIYNRDLGIKLVLVGNNDQLIYSGDPDGDPYTNDNGSIMLEENQTNIDAVIGTANYDIGHVFSTGGGGIAEVGSVCGSLKAGGVTGSSNPQGETFYIDYVAHEIGHQFSGQHTFNGTEQNCGGGNRWADSAYEPGSGSTIMSYAGICGAENISRNAIAVFHAGSIDLVDNFTTMGQGANCGVAEALLNNPNEPVANAGNDFIIPASTPYILKGSGNDDDDFDVLTYSWEEMDAGTETNSNTIGTDLGDNALIRSLFPVPLPDRYIPRLGTLLTGSADIGEALPTTDRSMNFRLTVRDGKSGMDDDDVQVTVFKTAKPFRVTSHQSAKTIAGGAVQQVTWDVAGTDSAPINCAQIEVNLLMMDETKNSYCLKDLSTVSNTRSAQVTFPELDIPNTRLMLSCKDHPFFAISAGDLKINGATVAKTDCLKVDSQSEVFNQDIADTGAATTTAYPAGGRFTSVQNVALIADEPATIYYTINGDTPTTSSSIYNSPIGVTGSDGNTTNLTLQFFSVDDAGNVESVIKETYTIDLTGIPVPEPKKSTGGSGSMSGIFLGWLMILFLGTFIRARNAV